MDADAAGTYGALDYDGGIILPPPSQSFASHLSPVNRIVRLLVRLN
jgi:hypothetical protein